VSDVAAVSPQAAAAERPTFEIDVACVGFGPAMGGFLTTLARALADGAPPLSVVCYERADDTGFGVSGVATRARALRASFPGIDASGLPLSTTIREEQLVYLLDPHGASRRSRTLRGIDRLLRVLPRALTRLEHEGLVLPWIPPFLRKDGGLVLSIGQLNQWVAQQLMAGGMVQVWPGTPVAGPLVEGTRVVGVRLVDQGTDPEGRPTAQYAPGMDVHAALTVVGDGPTGPVGRQLDERFGVPAGHHAADWAVGMKALVELREDTTLEPGTVVHTIGYPEPEIFGFLYVLPDRLAACGIFVPSWWQSPTRTAYRYLQHFMLHPWLFRHLAGGTLRSWGAKSIAESGRRGEPALAGDGWARIGEGSGSTNVLTGSGVDEAWATGVQLAEGVLELAREQAPFTRENLERAYVARRRASFVEAEGRVAERARDGFGWGFLPGLAGMALAGFTGGRLRVPGRRHEHVRGLEEHYRGRIAPARLGAIVADCAARGASLHDALMDACGWPSVPLDGRLLVTHQDALLVGGKVRAAAGYADHVVVLDPRRCETCGARLCVEVCSGQALTPGSSGSPAFDREKCVHCGACQWSCTEPHPSLPGRTNLELRAGIGGLHSSEN
jgi:electron-transferring-flavoprotein dehydrogenase